MNIELLILFLKHITIVRHPSITGGLHTAVAVDQVLEEDGQYYDQ